MSFATCIGMKTLIKNEPFITPRTLTRGAAMQFVIYSPEPEFLVQLRDTNELVSEKVGRPIVISMDGEYGPFGGGVEEGETPTECAIRECREELAIDLLSPEKYGLGIVNFAGPSVEPDFKENEHGVLEQAGLAYCFNYEVPVLDRELFESKLEIKEGRGVWLSLDDLLATPTVRASPRGDQRVISPTFKDVLQLVYNKRF